MHNAIVRRQTALHSGTEVKAQGDGFMLHSQVPGGRARMIETQRALACDTATLPADRLRIRVGIDTGEVVVGDDGDLFGPHVVVVSRIAGAAVGGEILVSSLVREIIDSRGDLEFDEPRSVTLKGLDGRRCTRCGGEFSELAAARTFVVVEGDGDDGLQ